MNERDTPKANIWMGLVQNAINGQFSMEQIVKDIHYLFMLRKLCSTSKPQTPKQIIQKQCFKTLPH